MKKLAIYLLIVLVAIGTVYAGFTTYNSLIMVWTSYFSGDIYQTWALTVEWTAYIWDWLWGVNISNAGLLTFTGVWWINFPHWMWSDNSIQSMGAWVANTWFAIVFNNLDDEAHWMYLSWWTGWTKIVVPSSWDYEFIISAICDVNTNGKYVDV